MTQYCRYCQNMVCGDVNYCSVKARTFTEQQICKTNTCKDFELNVVDALGSGKEYKPRPRKATNDNEQIKIGEKYG